MLDVNVFYHDTVHGLLTSDMNNQAVTQMHAMLLKHSEKAESICESVSDGDIKSDIRSRDSSASDSGTGGYDDDQRPSSIKGSSSLRGGNDQRGYGGLDFQGGGVGTRSGVGGNDQRAYGGLDFQGGGVGTRSSSSSSMGGNDHGGHHHNAGNADKETKASGKKGWPSFPKPW